MIFVFKSALGFLGLLILTLGLALKEKRREAKYSVIPVEFGIHWRVLWVSLACLHRFLSAEPPYYQHPSFQRTHQPAHPLIGRTPAYAGKIKKFRADYRDSPESDDCNSRGKLPLHRRAPTHITPYLNAFGLGRPAYALVNDSNLDWNRSLPSSPALRGTTRPAEDRGRRIWVQRSHRLRPASAHLELSGANSSG